MNFCRYIPKLRILVVDFGEFEQSEVVVRAVRTSQPCQRNKHALISFFCRKLERDFE